MTREEIIPNSLRLAAAGMALALAATYAAADGIPGVVMTDSRYLTDWSGVYIGGKLDGAFSSLSWRQELNNFTAASGVASSTPVDFSPSGITAGVIGGANLQLGQWIFGGEVSFSGTGLSQSVQSPFFPATDTFSTNLD
jgi:opacity protein-like surface antigen